MTTEANSADAVTKARAIVDEIAFMTIASADGDGRPWASPVWFAHDDYGQFLWVSRPGTVHSRNIAPAPRSRSSSTTREHRSASGEASTWRLAPVRSRTRRRSTRR